MIVDARKDSKEAERIRARIGGAWRDAENFQEVRDPYRGDVVAHAPVSTSRDCDDALAAAHQAKDVMAAMPGYERAALLRRVADVVTARSDEIGRVMALESGKALRDCVFEAQRSADTLRLCAEEAVRIQGEHIRMDASAIGAGTIAMVMRFPVGVVAAITPFNGPVNLAAQARARRSPPANSVY
ncbi:MAG: aldehyde dehydrogenase family protein [Betaproteobacteria bacterium]|nr:aldehyde dehydrogenase family protein [Betaproteobacteria bacterium]